MMKTGSVETPDRACADEENMARSAMEVTQSAMIKLADMMTYFCEVLELMMKTVI